MAPTREGGSGPLSFTATEILCQAPHPAHGRGIHGERLAIIAIDAEPTDRLLSDLRYVGRGEIGAWCTVCKLVTVYHATELEAA